MQVQFLQLLTFLLPELATFFCIEQFFHLVVGEVKDIDNLNTFLLSKIFVKYLFGFESNFIIKSEIE